MTKRKILKIGLIVVASGLLIGGGIVYYMFNMPHRDVQATTTDYQVQASVLVQEYLNNPDKANEKYLDEEGESKIFEVTGQIASISEDFNNQKVVLLKTPDDKAGVSCTFTVATNTQMTGLSEGDEVTIKGVIRAGATYDEDLEMYENVILEKCALVK